MKSGISRVYGAVRSTDKGEVTSPWLTTPEAARYCGFETAEGLLKYVREGELEPDNSDLKSSRFHVDTLDAWLGGNASEESDTNEHAEKSHPEDLPDSYEARAEYYEEMLADAIDEGASDE